MEETTDVKHSNLRVISRCGTAIGAVVLGLLLRQALSLWVGGNLPTYITFYPAVMLAAVLCGLTYGLVATAATALVVDYWVLEPKSFLSVGNFSDLVGLVLFLLMGTFMSVVAELLRRNRRKAAALEKQLALQESQELLRQQREWLRVTLTSIGDAVLATDSQARITFLNPVAATLTGWPEQEAAGRPSAEVFRIINEKTRQPAEDIISKVLTERRVVALANHTALIAKDGREVPIEDTAAPIKDSDGSVTGAVLVFHDVTQKRRAQEALRESERRVRLKLDSILSPQGDVSHLELQDLIDAPAVQSLMEDFHKLTRMPLAVIDTSGKVLVGVGWQRICTAFHRVNPESCGHCIDSDTQLTAGVAPGEFKLYKCKNNMWDVATPIYIGNRHVGNIFSGQFFFDGETLSYDFFRSQARRYGFDEQQYIAALEEVPRLSRETVNVGMAFLRNLAHMLSQLGYSNVSLARSLAERENLMQSLKDSEYRLNRAQEIAHLGSWELDLAANRLTWSDEVYRIFGLKPRQFAATYEAFLDAVHPDDRAAVDAAYRDSIREGKSSYDIEHRIIRWATGEVRWVLERCEHTRDAAGQILRSIGMVLDITEHKEALTALSETAEELRRSNKDLEQFAYVASHDLQEPLRMVTAYMQLFAQKYRGKMDEAGEQYIRFATDGSQRMSKLVEGLLAYSRAGRGNRQLELVSAQKAFDMAVANLKMTIEESGAKVLADPLPEVKADATQLAQVFQNLLANAIKFRSAQCRPEVHVGSSWTENGCEFFVRDNGIGIAPEHHGRIFQIFQRLHTRDKYPGTGIGLAICKKIVERHGGRIWLESAEGGGTTFRFCLRTA